MPFKLDLISDEDKNVMNLLHAVETGEMSVLPNLIQKICSDEQNKKFAGPNDGKFKPTPSSESLLAKKKGKTVRIINKKTGCVVM